MFIPNLIISRTVVPSWRKEKPTQMRVVVKQKQKILTSLMALHKLKTCFKYWRAKPRTPFAKDMLSNNKSRTVLTPHVPVPHNHSQHNHANTSCIYNYLVLLMMGMVMPETC